MIAHIRLPNDVLEAGDGGSVIARIRHPDDVLEAGDWRPVILLLEKTEAPVRGELRHDVAVKAMECSSHYVEEHASATKMIQQK